MTGFARHYLLAVQFFTRIPVTGALAAWVGFSPEQLRASAAHFPGVGWLIGAVCGLLAAGLLAGLPPHPGAALVVAALTTVVSVLLTGAFHEDGLADVADGVGGSLERERALDIMKDSRVGAFGALALVLVVTVKLSLLALIGAVNPVALCWGLFAAHVVSRFFPLLLIRSMRHVGDDARSRSKPLADRISGTSLLVAAGWVLAALLLVGWLAPVLPLAAPLLLGAVVTGLLRRWFARRLGGFTGDCLGATQQLAEVAFYLGLALALAP